MFAGTIKIIDNKSIIELEDNSKLYLYYGDSPLSPVRVKLTKTENQFHIIPGFIMNNNILYMSRKYWDKIEGR